jgi:hypothetical protein
VLNWPVAPERSFGPETQRGPERGPRTKFAAVGQAPLRHTEGMATEPSRSSSTDRFSVAELSVRPAESDLLSVDPLDFGPGAPATAALAAERGPQPDDVRQRDK